MTITKKPVVAGLAVLLLAVAAISIRFWPSTGAEQNETSRLTRDDVVAAFADQDITLEERFSAAQGPVDATYTIEGEPLGTRTPLVVELFRNSRRAQEREAFLMEEGPNEGLELTVIRAKNAVAVQNGREDELLEKVRAAMVDLND